MSKTYKDYPYYVVGDRKHRLIETREGAYWLAKKLFPNDDPFKRVREHKERSHPSQVLLDGFLHREDLEHPTAIKGAHLQLENAVLFVGASPDWDYDECGGLDYGMDIWEDGVYRPVFERYSEDGDAQEWWLCANMKDKSRGRICWSPFEVLKWLTEVMELSAVVALDGLTFCDEEGMLHSRHHYSIYRFENDSCDHEWWDRDQWKRRVT